MKWASFLAASLLAVSLVSEADPQETATKTEPVKPAPSPSGAILGQWNEIGRKLIAMAEDFPEDKYDFKGAASADGFSQRMIHAAAANYYFTNAATGKKNVGRRRSPANAVCQQSGSGRIRPEIVCGRRRGDQNKGR